MRSHVRWLRVFIENDWKGYPRTIVHPLSHYTDVRSLPSPICNCTQHAFVALRLLMRAIRGIYPSDAAINCLLFARELKARGSREEFFSNRYLQPLVYRSKIKKSSANCLRRISRLILLFVLFTPCFRNKIDMGIKNVNYDFIILFVCTYI